MKLKLFIAKMRNNAKKIILSKENGPLYMIKQWKLNLITDKDLFLILDIMLNLIWQKIQLMISNYYLLIFTLEIMVALILLVNKQWLDLFRLKVEEDLQSVIIELHAFLENKISNMILKVLLKNQIHLLNLHKFKDTLIKGLKLYKNQL